MKHQKGYVTVRTYCFEIYNSQSVGSKIHYILVFCKFFFLTVPYNEVPFFFLFLNFK